MTDIKITLETLYDILRNEKKREDLQKLDESFFIDVVAYLREKQSLIDSKSNDSDMFSTGEKEKLEYELRSIKRILKQLYESREKKILDIAMNKSRTGSDIIDTTAMLRIEKDFYERNLATLNLFRRGVLLQLFKGQLPDVIDTMPKTRFEPPIAAQTDELKQLEEDSHDKMSNDSSGEDSQDEFSSNLNIRLDTEIGELEDADNIGNADKSENEITHESEPGFDKIKIKFTHPVPSFVWKDMKEYGPFDSGEETEIFPEVADLLVRKGRAEKV